MGVATPRYQGYDRSLFPDAHHAPCPLAMPGGDRHSSLCRCTELVMGHHPACAALNDALKMRSEWCNCGTEPEGPKYNVEGKPWQFDAVVRATGAWDNRATFELHEFQRRDLWRGLGAIERWRALQGQRVRITVEVLDP